MKALWYDRFGPAGEVLTLGEMPDPTPGPGEVLVRVKASGVNPSDVKLRAGARPGAIFNMSVGYDLAGIRKSNVQWYLDVMNDSSEYLNAYIDIVAERNTNNASAPYMFSSVPAPAKNDAASGALRRTIDDINSLLDLKPNIRICKGIYREPRTVAWKDFWTVRANFVAAVQKLLGAGAYVGIATHDTYLVWAGMAAVDRLGLDPEDGVVRTSFVHYNSPEEIERLIEVFDSIF